MTETTYYNTTLPKKPESPMILRHPTPFGPSRHNGQPYAKRVPQFVKTKDNDIPTSKPKPQEGSSMVPRRSPRKKLASPPRSARRKEIVEAERTIRKAHSPAGNMRSNINALKSWAVERDRYSSSMKFRAEQLVKSCLTPPSSRPCLTRMQS